MRNDISKGKRQQIRGKKRLHWGILTLDDPDKSNGKHSRMITRLQAQYRPENDPGKDESNGKSEDYSI